MPGSNSETVQTRDSPPVDKESAAYLKRREQVRRAQRTHRERKESYIKSLEDENHQLRANERRILQQIDVLANELAELKKSGRASGATSTSQSECSASGSTSLDNSSWLNTHLNVPLLEVENYVYSGSESLPSWTVPSLDDSEGSRIGSVANSVAGSESYSVVPYATMPATTTASMDITTLTRLPSPKLLGEGNQTDMAMEFILTLEKPCFNRASSAVFDMGHPSDLTVKVSPSGLDYHNYLKETFLPSFPGSNPDPGPSTQLQRRDAELSTNQSLDKLFALSSNFGLTSEVTPIQAWQQIVSHPKFGSVRVETLRKLVDDMLEHVRCYGFGAVIETTIYKMLCTHIFG